MREEPLGHLQVEGIDDLGAEVVARRLVTDQPSARLAALQLLAELVRGEPLAQIAMRMRAQIDETGWRLVQRWLLEKARMDWTPWSFCWLAAHWPQWTVEHPDCPREVLGVLMALGDQATLRALAAKPWLRPEDAGELLRAHPWLGPSYLVGRALLANRALPESWRRQVLEQESWALEFVEGGIHAEFPEHLPDLLGHPSPGVRSAIAVRHSPAPLELASDPEPEVRAALARNPNLPAGLLATFAGDPEPVVQGSVSVAARQRREWAALNLLARSGCPVVRRELASLPDLDLSVYADLTRSDDREILEVISHNPNPAARRMARERLEGGVGIRI